jgi:hypothetical protein
MDATETLDAKEIDGSNPILCGAKLLIRGVPAVLFQWIGGLEEEGFSGWEFYTSAVLYYCRARR